MNRVILHRIIIGMYCAFLVVSLVFFVPATLNYLEFWAALGHLYLKVEAFTWSKTSVEGLDAVNITSRLVLLHNSSYVGLKLHSVDVVIYYGSQYEALHERRFLLRELPLDPFSSVNLTIANETSLPGVTHFFALKDKGEPVQLHFSTSVNAYLLGQSTPDRIYLDDAELTV